METEAKETIERTEIDFADRRRLLSVSSDTADNDPIIILTIRAWDPMFSSDAFLPVDIARQLGEMLIAHAARFGQ